MKPKSQVMLKSLLARSGHEEELLKFLPAPLSEEIGRASAPESYPLASLFSLPQWAEKIHFSWFAQVLKEYPSPVQSLFLSSLNPSQAEAIKGMLSRPPSSRRASSFLRPFLIDVLQKSLQEPDLLSEQHLPPSSLNILLRLERKILLHVVDMLGLHDLAIDLRQVVDKTLLSKVNKVLTAQQLQFLQYCSKQPIKWISPKLGLLAWDGSQQQLNHLLHYRGLIRLAKAIAQENPSFKWHLMHRVDTGRAKIIQKELYQKQDPSLIPYFKNQVLHIASRYAS